ncbi:outer membrane lipid asymmetry maintenance protein MlaD [alpha proteobacterium AAP81b]|nr:outer membrane lipid asymmetry maintenance protein MlaD [alpha proteobacterium AAP81b]
MGAALRDNVVEALIGLVVVLVAVGFVLFAWNRTQAGSAGDGYVLKARFPNVTGVSPGTDVRLAGIRVGTVAAQALDPTSYQAVLDLRIDRNLKLPVDSSAAITSEGVLGGSFIALTPGGDPAALKPGEEITETSGSADLMGLIGSFVNRPSSGGEAAAPAPASPPPAK